MFYNKRDSIIEASKAKKGDYVKTIFGIAQIEKVKGSIAFMKLPGKKTKGYWMNDLKHLKPTGEKESGKDLWTESVNERKLSSHQKKAILIAIEMSGNMTGATKKIEKIKKGLSDDKKVKDALQLANESINEAYPWHRLDLSQKEESFFEEMEYKIERMHPKKDKQINAFIVSVIDVYSQPQNDMSDAMSKYGMDDILKHVKRKGLKPLKRAV